MFLLSIPLRLATLPGLTFVILFAQAQPSPLVHRHGRILGHGQLHQQSLGGFHLHDAGGSWLIQMGLGNLVDSTRLQLIFGVLSILQKQWLYHFYSSGLLKLQLVHHQQLLPHLKQ